MSKADEMFKDAEYTINNNFKNTITFSKKKDDIFYNIHFWKDKRAVSKNGDVESVLITMQELQAIYEKVKELRLDRRRR